MEKSCDPADWKKERTFLERLEVINKFKGIFVLDVEDESSAMKPEFLQSCIVRAQAEESRCMELAETKQQYNDLCCARARELEDLHAGGNQTLKQDEGASFFSPSAFARPTGPVTRIGPYEAAVPFESGLFSTIYRSPPLPSPGQTIDDVALKVTNPSHMTPPHNSGRESRILAAASGHPNILPFLEAFDLPSSNFVIVTPCMDAPLSFLLEKDLVTAQRALRIAHDIISGLAHLHSQEILHRDIKPSNILFDHRNGRAVIADFGIAWWARDQTTEPQERKICDVGTTCYRAPELLFGYQAYGEAVDIWAAGCVLAECLAPDHKSLFTAGDLGSELRLLASIFQTLGTPTLQSWPEASNFPDFGKINFLEYPKKAWSELLPNASPETWDLLDKILVYESGNRLTAAEALRHPLFAHLE